MAITFSDEYWIVDLPYMPKLKSSERSALRKEQREKLTAAGFKHEYRYPLKSEGLARAMAKRIKDATGIEMNVGKAFNMGF